MNTGVADGEGDSGSDDTHAKVARGIIPLPEEAKDDPHFDYTLVLDIRPETALDLLCVAIDKLEAMSTADVLCAQAGNVSALNIRSEPPSGQETPVQVEELHFQNPGRDHVQESLLAKRFLSKREPTITLKEYLSRFNRYCPLSTGVYLTASLYITRIANVERTITVVPKNMHRLVLAALRVAMKTVEDLVYSHIRVAKVGGVTETELTRLEVSFCFLADFNLCVDNQMLEDQARALQWHMEHSSRLKPN